MGKRQRGEGSIQREDQYGDTFVSQDRDSHFQPSGSGRKLGGSAGGSSRGEGVSYQRHIPKFLQPFAHMLGGKRQYSEDPLVVNPVGAEDPAEEDDDDETAAIQRALEENPKLEAQIGSSLLKKAQALEEKVKGNQAFTEKRYEDAVQHFTACAEMDPGNPVYMSNRSAAYAQMQDYEKALQDAKKVVALKPDWVKGWARLAAAHFGLKEYADAKEAYSRALQLEPNDHTLQRGHEKAQMEEMRQAKDHKHVFKKARRSTGEAIKGDRPSNRGKIGSNQDVGKKGGTGDRKPPAGPKSKMLSFADDEEGNQEG